VSRRTDAVSVNQSFATLVLHATAKNILGRRFKKLEKEIEELKKGSSKQEQENDSDFWKRYEETKPK
jgi:nucleosome binding factor SPN SPT16 subunit